MTELTPYEITPEVRVWKVGYKDKHEYFLIMWEGELRFVREVKKEDA